MRMRRWSWLLVCGMHALGVRAQSQQPSEGPPVPPDTEEVERARAAPSAPKSKQESTPSAAVSGAQSSGPRPQAPPASEPPPEPSTALSKFPPAPAPSTGAPQAQLAPSDMPPPPPAASPDAAPADSTPPASSAETVPPQASVPPGPWSAGILLGLGATFDHTTGGVNPLGFGFGLRGEYRLEQPWALGARVQYFAGGSSDLPTGRVSMQSWLIAAEGSYVFRLDPLLIQPGVLLGVYVREIDNRPSVIALPDANFGPGSQNRTQVGLYIAPGVSLSVPLSVIARELDHVFAGLDMRLDLALGSRVTSNLQLMFQLGVRF